eukprot:TRINITY_DN1344_c0_g1_i1.p1 TRINITY_DN1344_c0_g1~~TRINITY_DN1344_c0_g1_i1.p1  ORF type:complete len:220 (+),score=63.41 TRINITY_DN1344_c0_g1_i1:100-759(+)
MATDTPSHEEVLKQIEEEYANIPKPKAWIEWEEQQKALIRKPKETDNMIVKLKSSDDKTFEVKRIIAEMSKTIEDMLNDIPLEEVQANFIPIPNVTGAILEKVLEYCKYHHENPTKPDMPPLPPIPTFEEKREEKRTDDICQWDMDFLSVPQDTLFEIILAANFLDNKALLEVSCKTVANMMKGKSIPDIRKMFNIKNDYTPEEEEEERRNNEWIEERS